MHVCIQDVHQEAGGRARRVPKAHRPDILAYAAEEQERFCFKEGKDQKWHLRLSPDVSKCTVAHIIKRKYREGKILS